MTPVMADAVDDFIAQVRAGGAATAILAWQEEWDLTSAGGYGPVRRARLLAYARGEVIAADLPDEAVDRDALQARLRLAGLTVVVRPRNRG